MTRRRTVRTRAVAAPFALMPDGTLLVNAALESDVGNIEDVLAAAAARSRHVFVGVPLPRRLARVLVARLVEAGIEGAALIAASQRRRPRR